MTTSTPGRIDLPNGYYIDGRGLHSPDGSEMFSTAFSWEDAQAFAAAMKASAPASGVAPRSAEVLQDYNSAYNALWMVLGKLESCGEWDAVKDIHRFVSEVYSGMGTPASYAQLEAATPDASALREAAQKAYRLLQEHGGTGKLLEAAGLLSHALAQAPMLSETAAIAS